MKREINLPSKSLIPECWGYKGEVEHSRLIITLPDDIAACDYCQAEVAVKGKRYLTDRLEIADSKVSFELTAAMVKESGAISAQAIGYVVDEAGNIGEIGKTPIYRGTIKPSVSGEISETPEEAEFWQRCWSRLQALTESKHAHNNKVVLDKLHCLRDELEPDSIIAGNPPMGLTYDGWPVRMVSQGKVIKGVGEIEKGDSRYLRLSLSPDSEGITLIDIPDFIDIPISSMTEVTDSIGGIITNGSEIELDIPEFDIPEFDIPEQHTHDNKAVLDIISKDTHGNLHLGNVIHWAVANGGVIENFETDEVTGDITIFVRLIPNPVIPATEIKIKQSYPEIWTEIEEIRGGIDEIETLIDESGALANWKPTEAGDSGEKWELIEEIVIEESIGEFVRESEPDGKPYDFKGIYVQLYSPNTNGEHGGRFYFYCDNENLLSPSISFTAVNDYISFGVAELFGSGIQIPFTTSMSRADTSTGLSITQKTHIDKHINRIKFAIPKNDAVLMKDDVIKIYGMRW